MSIAVALPRFGASALPLALLAVTGLALLEGSLSKPGEMPMVAVAARQASAPASAYDAALAQMDGEIEDASERARSRPGEWVMHEALARSYVRRAKLTGSYDDFEAAQAALDRAFAVATPGTGPHLAQAALDLSLHRLGRAAAMLDRVKRYAVPPAGLELADTLAMQADIALYSGDPAAARLLYERTDAVAPGEADFRLAVYHLHLGDYGKAAAFLDRAELGMLSPSPQMRAFLEINRGILELEQDRLGPALVHFRKADRIFPGYWLAEEHIAEVLARTGRAGEARKIYRRVVGRTGHPEYVDALAGIAEQEGELAEAARLRAASAKAWSRRLRQFPEAAYGHALDHCLTASKPRCALELARRNHEARPYGEAKLKLAEALLLNGKGGAASGMVAEAERSGSSPLKVEQMRRRIAEAGR